MISRKRSVSSARAGLSFKGSSELGELRAEAGVGSAFASAAARSALPREFQAGEKAAVDLRHLV